MAGRKDTGEPHDAFKKEKLLHSDGKIELFYKSVMLALLLLAILLAFANGITLKDSALFNTWYVALPNTACHCHLCVC
jgi:hypothetical protein